MIQNNLTPDQLFDKHSIFIVPCYSDDIEDMQWQVFLSREESEYLLSPCDTAHGYEFQSSTRNRTPSANSPSFFKTYQDAYDTIVSISGYIPVFSLAKIQNFNETTAFIV